MNHERIRFEIDAATYGFDLTRVDSPAPEPWSEYADPATGHRWGGWQARSTYSDNVSPIGCITTLPIPAETVLDAALKHKLITAVVIGYDEHGELYFASSAPDGGDVLWLMAKAKAALLET